MGWGWPGASGAASAERMVATCLVDGVFTMIAPRLPGAAITLAQRKAGSPGRGQNAHRLARPGRGVDIPHLGYPGCGQNARRLGHPLAGVSGGWPDISPLALVAGDFSPLALAGERRGSALWGVVI